jgi:hypothetical protein
MTAFNLREAAEAAGTSKSSIWRAIKSGRMSAGKTDLGVLAIDSSELFRCFAPGNAPAKQPAKSLAMDETAVKQALAVAEANLQSLKAMLDEVKATRDDLRRERDIWMEQARQLLLAAPIAVSPAPSPAPELPPFHHTARAGATAAPAPVPAPDQRRPWWRRLAG